MRSPGAHASPAIDPDRTAPAALYAPRPAPSMDRSFHIDPGCDMQTGKREELLATAERLFYEEGFHATGIDRVVAGAGVARMTLYNHFPSKEALIEQVLERRFHRYLDELRDTIDRRGGATAVTALVECHCRWLRSASREGCIVIKAIAEFEHHSAGIARQGRQLEQELLALIRDALARDGQPADAAAAERVLLALEGANTLAPVLGPGRAAAHLRAMLPAALGACAAESA
ncbi:MAG: TetR/AcrR family transcriptional regulator [Halofilum sp. (in: g-proteobacteria)]|nr:TetR/AcrR family transcriptional regulator [Halofilum sp. (in: g-proteobacteria)]